MAHTLTFNYDDPMSGYTVCKGSKNGEKIHSPYTLQNGDVLYFTTIKLSNTINGTSYDSEDLRNVTLEFADVDVNIVGGSGPQLSIDYSPFVLKYTESGGSTNKVSIDLTTLTGWDNVTAGEHQISVVAKATGYRDSEKSTAISFTKASAKVLLEKGTYQFIENPNMNISIDETISGKMNTLTGNNTYGEQTSFDGISVVDSAGQIGMVFIGNSTSGNNVQCAGGDWKYANTDGDEYTTTDTSKLRTIVLEADQQVSPEFYNWAITQGNLVKVEETTGETWVLNDALSGMLVGSYKIKFTSNNKKYSEIQFLYDTDDGIAVWYWDISGDNYDVSYNDMGSPKGWQNPAYKTITFETAPTGELLTWLQANGTKQGGSSVSKNWKFNGTPAFVPQKTYDNHVTISGEAYNDTTFVANFDYIYYADDWSYITFGSGGFWDISKNQYGKNNGNILKFNTEPSGELLAFLQAHTQPI